MSAQTVNPKQVIITLGGVPITGYADGEFVNITRENDSFNKSAGADGQVTRVASGDRSGTVVLTLAQSSLSNDYLSGLIIQDEATNDAIVPLAIKDLSGNTVVFAEHAWVRKPTDAAWGKDVQTREWNIDCADLDMLIGGNSPFSPV